MGSNGFMQKKKRFIAKASLASIVFAFAQSPSQISAAENLTKLAELQSQSQSQKVLRIGIGAEPSSLDPQLATGAPARQVFKGLFEGLVVEDSRGSHALPGIAKSWDISPDGLTYTFHLRNSSDTSGNAKWSTGDPITAYDFLESFQRVLSPKFPAQQKAMLYAIRGAEQFASAKDGKEKSSSDFSSVGVKALDASTLEIILERPTPYLLDLIANQYIWDPVPICVFKKNHKEEQFVDGSWARPDNIVTDGPFNLIEFKHAQRIVVEKSASYWNKDAVALNRIELYPISDSNAEEALYRTGKLDITSTLPLSKIDVYLKENPQALQIAPYAGVFFLRFNTKNTNSATPQLADARVRKALALGIDRKSLVRNVTRGGQLPAYTLTYPNLGGYGDGYTSINNEQSNNETNNLAKAKQLLADAGYPDGRGFPQTELLYNTNPNLVAISEALQAMWQKNLGVHIELRNQEFGVLQTAQKTGDYQIARAGWVADYADESSFLDLLTSANPNNMTGWHNAAYDALAAQAHSTVSQSSRNEIYSTMARMVDDEMPVLPIYYMTQVRLVSPNVKNYNPTLFDSHPLKDISLQAQK